MNPLGGEPKLPPRTVALTFDDGPGPKTAELAQMLSAKNIPATFFILGENVDQHEDALAECARLRHTIALHGFSHERWTDPQTALTQLDACAARIARYLPPRPWFRPPFGQWPVGADVSSKYAGPVGWHADGGDWRITFRKNTQGTRATPLHAPADCVQMILSQLEPLENRGIVVLHDYSCSKEIRENHVLPRHIRIIEITSLLIAELQKRDVTFAAL
jgi:peptidoglycan/xylan/chitin deacetylase (PgdA/CDA1 family)